MCLFRVTICVVKNNDDAQKKNGCRNTLDCTPHASILHTPQLQDPTIQVEAISTVAAQPSKIEELPIGSNVAWLTVQYTEDQVHVWINDGQRRQILLIVTMTT